MHFGTVGVVSVQFAPKVKTLTPAKGWASGAVRKSSGSAAEGTALPVQRF